MRKLLIPFLLFLAFAVSIGLIVADVDDDLNKVSSDLAKQQKQLADLEKRQQQLSRDIASASISLSQVSSQLTTAEKELSAIEKDLDAKEDALADWKANRDALVRELYKQNRTSSLEIIFSANDLEGSAHQFQYYNANLNTLHSTITKLTEEITVFQSNRAAAKKLRDDLAALKAQYQTGLYYSQSQYSSTSNQVISTKSTIKNLTAKQEQLILAKIGNSLATGSLVLAGDPNSRVTYNPGFSPAFAAFSFGAYTHRNGMSQYGALGRANKGQSAEQILAAYYPTETLNKNYSIPSTITVSGTNEYGQTFDGSKTFSLSVCYQDANGGTNKYDSTCIKRGGKMNFTEYLKHLYEVPSSWPTAVLRAQAVAARSYAIKRGSPICPSQSCQVVKFEINASSWRAAVDVTAKWVLTGGIGNFQYSSTTGGYLNTSGWDTTTETQSSWPDNAYENIAGSSWFYKGWYKNLSSQACGRSNPWLTETQFADILNSWVVYIRGNSTDKSRVTSWDIACWGGSPYSISQMKSRAEALGDAYTRVYGVAASFASNGQTSLISLATDRGTLTIDGQVFKDIFNLRSPGYLAIKTPLFNIEKK
jgi:peptidoglycan hydrolase-like amidase